MLSLRLAELDRDVLQPSGKVISVETGPPHRCGIAVKLDSGQP